MTKTTRIAVLLALFAALALSAGCGDSKPPEPRIESLVTADWLAGHLDDPDLIVLDCTVEVEMGEDGQMRQLSGRDGYEAGHVPGAGFADLMGDLSDADSPLGFTPPTPERFCEVMGALGVGDDARVVLYDRYKSVWAARVWWMLCWVGFDDAALLDGGWAAWAAGKHPITSATTAPAAATLTPHPRPTLFAERDEVSAALDDPTIVLIDAMPEAHYLGKMAMYDRPGHIPGAINVSAMALLDETGRFRPPDELAAMHDGDRDARTITYCGAGIAASADAFVLHRLGYTDVAVYTASLQEWAADPDAPLTVEGP